MNDLDKETRDEVKTEDDPDEDGFDELDERSDELDDNAEDIDLEDGEDHDDPDDAGAGELRAVAAVEEELSQREQNARSLAVRRAIERRMEQKRLDEDLDYLDLED